MHGRPKVAYQRLIADVRCQRHKRQLRAGSGTLYEGKIPDVRSACEALTEQVALPIRGANFLGRQQK